MKTRSCKAKGRRLQQQVRDTILEHFPSLEPDDVRCAIMGEAGQDIKLSPAAKKCFPFATECKNQEALNIWSALEQAEGHATETQSPLLVFKRNHSETYVALNIHDFMKLIQATYKGE